MRRAYYGHTRKDYKKRMRKKRDWHRSEFNNPYFSKPHPINLKPYLYPLLAVAIILTLSYVFLFLDYWKISSASIRTDNEIYREKVENIIDNSLNSTVFNILSGDNYFLFNSGGVEEKIANELLVKDLEVQKKLPNKLIVNFQEIDPAYIWIQDNKYYNIDEGGMVLDEIISVQQIEPVDEIEEQEFDIDEIKKFLQHSTANLDLPIIYNESGAELNTRDYISDKDIFQSINDLNSKLKRHINTEVVLYKVDIQNFKKIEVITEPGWKIYFDAENDLSEQLENLYSIMQNTFKETQPTEYIDLRYGNKVYYK